MAECVGEEFIVQTFLENHRNSIREGDAPVIDRVKGVQGWDLPGFINGGEEEVRPSRGVSSEFVVVGKGSVEVPEAGEKVMKEDKEGRARSLEDIVGETGWAGRFPRERSEEFGQEGNSEGGMSGERGIRGEGLIMAYSEAVQQKSIVEKDIPGVVFIPRTIEPA